MIYEEFNIIMLLTI